jgi:hypothetical protein
MMKPSCLLICLIAAGLCGCAGDRTAPPPRPVGLEALHSWGTERPRDARAAMPLMYHLDIYQLTVPYGTVSHNEQFWKRIHEQSVDVPTYDLLYKNGVRVGQAAIGEWDYFRDIIEENPASSSRTSVMGIQPRTIELEMKTNVPFQDIFYFDRSHVLVGRSFEISQNILSLTFEPAARRSDEVRVSLVPVVRSARRRLEVRGSGPDRQIQYVNPERLFDLNLLVDLPTDSFLVVAPSTDGQWPTSIGNRFLVVDGASERFEQVLLLVPQVHRLEATGDRQRKVQAAVVRPR